MFMRHNANRALTGMYRRRAALSTALTSDSGFDPEILRTVFATLSIYPVQSAVRLNNGYSGTVVESQRTARSGDYQVTADQTAADQTFRIDLSNSQTNHCHREVLENT